MPNAFENKDLAAAAGRKSGPSKKSKQWNQLGDFITAKGAERAMNILNTLDDSDYLDQYGKLLNYFKPRLQATSLDANLSGGISIQPIDWVDDQPAE